MPGDIAKEESASKHLAVNASLLHRVECPKRAQRVLYISERYNTWSRPPTAQATARAQRNR
jgi:hypothetical protein